MDSFPIHNPNLEGAAFLLQGGPIGVLLIHGFTATTAEVRPLASRLHQVGYTVSGPLLPGHFSHPRDLNRVRWQDWVQEVDSAYQRLAADCKRVVVGGESTGGLLSLELAIRHPEIQALVLYAVALRLVTSPYERMLLHLLSPFVSYINKGTMDSNSLWQGYPVIPLKGALQLIKLQKFVVPRLSLIQQPLLIVQGRLDSTVHPSVPEQISSQSSSKVKEIHWYEQSGHCVILDRELDQVAATTLQFLSRVLNGSSPQFPASSQPPEAVNQIL